MTEDQIKHMAHRFLGWRLPENFNPDAGISFKAAFNENTPYPMKHEPTGTNLFDATQADAMVRYMIEGMPSDNGAGESGEALQKPDFMGTREDAEAALVEKWSEWRKYQGAFIDTRKGHREREAMECEARRRLVDAGATLAWHINFDALASSTHPTPNPGDRHVG